MTWEALVTESGEVRRPEQPCPHTMDQLDDETWSCPMHGLITVVDGVSEKWQDYVDSVVAQNGKRRRLRRLFRRG